MKKFSWHSRIAVALLLVVMMVFSVVSVTAFAATENVNGAGDEVTKTSYDEPWYTITYIPPQNGEEAKLDVQIKTAYSKYLEITKQDAIDLVKQIISVATQYAMDSVLGTNSGEIASADYGFALVASVGSVNIPDGLKGVLKNFLEEQFGTSDFSSVEELKEHVQANPEVKENLKEKVESVTNGEFDVVIQVAVDQYVGNNATAEELDEINEKIQSIVDEVLPDVIEVVYDEDGDGVLSEEEKVVVEEVKQKVTETVSANVNKVVEVKKEGGSIYSNLSITDIVKSFKTVTIDDQVVLSRVNGLTIDYNAIVNALKKIPMPGEMAEYSVEDFKSLLAYDLGVEFAFGSFGIDVSFGLTGNEAELSKVKAVMGLVSSHVDIDVTKDGEFAVELLIPDEFAALVLRAANSGMIPDSLKHKVFTLLDKNGNDIVAFINEDLTLDEIITLLQSIDYEKVIDKALGKDIILKLAKKAGLDDNLDNLTNEQIDAKLDALAAKLGVYYNKAIKLVVRATDYIPEKFMDKTLSDFYVGEGVFHATEDVTINEELIIKAFDKFEAVVTKERIAKLLDKAGNVFNQDEVDTILAKLGTDLTKEELAAIYDSVVDKIDGYVLANYDKALEYIKPVILAAWGNREVTLNFDVTVEFLDIYQIQFVDGNNVVKGFLPVGADINFFANNANVNTWIGVDDGEIYTTMPSKDVVLQPAGQFTTWVEYNGGAVTNVEGVYTKDGYTLVANVEYARDAVITYQWYNDNGAIEGATNALYTIVNVLDSGNYWCEVTVVDAEASVNKTVATEKVNVAIEKAVYDDFASVTLNKNEVIYNADNQTVALVLPVGFPEEIEVQYDETLLTKKDAGTYDVVVTFVSDNYVVPSTSTVLTWKIAAKSINLKDYGVKWQNTVTFGYDKTEHAVVLTGLDEFTLFDIVAKYTANKATDAGAYTAEVTFEYNNNNYVVEAFETCTWKIEKKVINLGDITLTWVINGGAVNWKTNSAYPYTVEYTGTEYVVTYVVDYNGKDYADYIEITVTYGTDANKDNKGTDVGTYSTDFTIAQTLKVAEKNIEFTGSLVFGVNPFEWEIVSVPSTECEHVDADDNGKCDKCGVDFEDGVDIIVPPCTHRDANDDGKCDKCGVDFTDGKDIPDDDTPDKPEDKVVELVPGVTVTIPGGATANLSATDVTENYLKDKITAGLEKGYVGKVIAAYDITGDFVKGIKVTFNIPADYVTHSNLAIYYIDAEGNATLVNSAVVGEKIVFEPEHFSVYALVAVEEESNWWIWLVVALAVVVVVAVIVIIIVVKRRKKDDDEGDEDDTDAPAPTAPITVVSAPVVVVNAPNADAKATENMVQITNAEPKVVYATPEAKGSPVNTTPFVGEATVKFPGLSSAKVASPVNSEGFAEKKKHSKKSRK